MNPTQPEAGLNLPAPVAETQTARAASNEVLPPAASPEQAASQLSTPPVASTPAPAILPVPPMAQAASTDTAGMSQTATGAGADDKDLIEKEWVERAKRIVEQTRDDPYKQSEELTVVKADYMKTHYNKTIKLVK